MFNFLHNITSPFDINNCTGVWKSHIIRDVDFFRDSYSGEFINFFFCKQSYKSGKLL